MIEPVVVIFFEEEIDRKLHQKMDKYIRENCDDRLHFKGELDK